MGKRKGKEEGKEEDEEEKKYDKSYFLALRVCTRAGFVMSEEEAKRRKGRGGVGCGILGQNKRKISYNLLS